MLPVMPTLVFIRGLDGRRDDAREANTREFLSEVKRDGQKLGVLERKGSSPATRFELASRRLGTQ